MKSFLFLLVLLPVCLTVACREKPAAAPLRYDEVPRLELNRLAADLALPLFWSEDKNNNGVLDTDELAVVWGMSSTSRGDWVQGSQFTPRFAAAYAAIRARRAGGQQVAGLSPEEARRRAAIGKDLDQGRLSLIESDFTSASAQDKAILAHLVKAAGQIEILHRKQLGSFGMDSLIPGDDPASRTHFYINQSPWCTAAATEKDEFCNSVPTRPAKISGLYPAAIQAKADFCEALAARPDAEQLLSPFTLVSEGEGGALAAVPYTQVYGQEMQALSVELEAAAAAVTSAEEAAFKRYLLAAAKAFRDNEWFAADEAWAAMNAGNSKWYLRIGPDETYFEPCSRKAGFHMSFARINESSKKWQQKLEPVRNDMEAALAKLAGPPYAARQVSFAMPDFIDIVLNAGDSRSERGATIGQSLPNWGPVANEGRGRTVVMTNLYTDPDNLAAARAQSSSLLCSDTMNVYSDDQEPQLVSILLHEAAHNLGPAHEYKVGGKTDDQIFGGPLAAVVEELKAQTSALYFTDWLVGRGLLDKSLADKAHVRDVTWAFGHISRGMYTADNKPKPYSQLAAIEMGYFLREGSLVWQPEALAANGTDKGCFSLRLDLLPAHIEKLEQEVAQIKGSGNATRAKTLVTELVDADGPWKDLRATIAERWQRLAQATFLYSIRQ